MDKMVGIIVYEKAAAEYNQYYIKQYIDEGAALGLEISLCIYEDLSFGICNNKEVIRYQGKVLSGVAFAINRTRESILSRQFEQIGIPVFNSSIVCEVCNNKALTYQYLAKSRINMIDTIFLRNDQLKSFLSSCLEECVIKAVHGHGGSQVCLYQPQTGDVKARQEEILRIIGTEDVVVQPLIIGRRQDLRVYVIGNEIIAAVLRSAKDDFRANYSLGGSVQLYDLCEKERKIVQKIISLFDFDYVGIDFLIGQDGELIFNEIEDVVGARMLYQCSDIDVVPLYLAHILEKLVI